MKKRHAIFTAAGILLLFVLSGCGPSGGTLTLINESSYPLTSKVIISLGDSSVDTLDPGMWMKASVDKNVNANVRFSLADGKNKVVCSAGGTWLLDRFTSSLVPVNSGESVIVTVRNKIGE
jgi:hypothetical protein